MNVGLPKFKIVRPVVSLVRAAPNELNEIGESVAIATGAGVSVLLNKMLDLAQGTRKRGLGQRSQLRNDLDKFLKLTPAKGVMRIPRVREN